MEHFITKRVHKWLLVLKSQKLLWMGSTSISFKYKKVTYGAKVIGCSSINLALNLNWLFQSKYISGIFTSSYLLRGELYVWNISNILREIKKVNTGQVFNRIDLKAFSIWGKLTFLLIPHNALCFWLWRKLYSIPSFQIS